MMVIDGFRALLCDDLEHCGRSTVNSCGAEEVHAA